MRRAMKDDEDKTLDAEVGVEHMLLDSDTPRVGLQLEEEEDGDGEVDVASGEEDILPRNANLVPLLPTIAQL